MATPSGATPRARLAGRLLILCGVVGVTTGGLPFLVAALRIAACAWAENAAEWATYRLDSLGLSLEWAALSSSCGAMLGALLLAAGVGWCRGRAWAPAVTLIYAVSGLAVTGVDLVIFVVLARPGAERTNMIVLDAIAFAAAAIVLIALIAWWRRQPS